MTRRMEKQAVEDAKRLKKIWTEKKDVLFLSQTKAADEFGYNSQGSVSQYLNGKVALNMSAVAKFAKLLQVNVSDISPTFGELVGNHKPESIDNYVAPILGTVSGVSTSIVLDWFAVSKTFAKQMQTDASSIKLIKLADNSYKDLPSGSLMLLDETFHPKPTDGLYMLEIGGELVVRKLQVKDGSVHILGGDKRMTLSIDTYQLLKIVAKIWAVIKPV